MHGCLVVIRDVVQEAAIRTCLLRILRVDTSIDRFDGKVGTNGRGEILFIECLEVSEVGEFFKKAGNSKSVALYSSGVIP